MTTQTTVSTTSDRPARKRAARAEKRRRLSRGKYVCAWIEANCVHTKGKWAGKPGERVPFRLLKWQRRLIMRLFEVEPDAAGVLRRVVLRALIGLAKKNGKTELMAALACYFAFGDDEPNPLVICAAAAEDQADLVFGAAAFMCRESPTLSQLCEVSEAAGTIKIPSNDGEIRRVAAVGGLGDGVNASVVILDELHEWTKPKHLETYRVLTKAGGARDEPLLLQITTAGSDAESICGEQYEYGQRVATGELDDRSFLFAWWELPPDADHTDEDLWPLANPSLGHTVNASYLRSQLTIPENEWRRYFGNQWVSSVTGLFHDRDWNPLALDGLELDPALPLYVGIDVGIYHDSSAIACSQWNPALPAVELDDDELEALDEDARAVRAGGRIALDCSIWENPYPEKHTLHRSWKLPIAEIENALRSLAERFPVSAADVDDRPVPGPAFLFDPQFMEDLAQRLVGDGLNMIKFRQDDTRMIPASMSFYKLVRDRVPAHAGDNPALRRHLKNTIAEPKPYERWRLSKPKGSRRKIDGAIASAISVAECNKHRSRAARRQSVYKTRGVVIVGAE